MNKDMELTIKIGKRSIRIPGLFFSLETDKKGGKTVAFGRCLRLFMWIRRAATGHGTKFSILYQH